MEIRSTVFKNNGIIPNKYSCKGENISPDLEFIDVPSRTISLVLVVDDPDAPNGVFTHWVVYNIPGETLQIPEGGPTMGLEAKNSAGENKYIGPCPPSGTHRYFFKVFALSEMLPVDAVSNKDDLVKLMKDKILEEAELMGKFTK